MENPRQREDQEGSPAMHLINSLGIAAVGGLAAASEISMAKEGMIDTGSLVLGSIVALAATVVSIWEMDQYHQKR